VKKGMKGWLFMMTLIALMLTLTGCAVMEGGTPPVDTPSIVEEYPTEEQETAMPQLTDVTLNYDPDTPTVVTITFVFEGEDFEGVRARANARLTDRNPYADEFDVRYKGEGAYEVDVILIEDPGVIGEMWRIMDITLEDEIGNTSEGGVGIGTIDGVPYISWITIGRGTEERGWGISPAIP